MSRIITYFWKRANEDYQYCPFCIKDKFDSHYERLTVTCAGGDVIGCLLGFSRGLINNLELYDEVILAPSREEFVKDICSGNIDLENTPYLLATKKGVYFKNKNKASLSNLFYLTRIKRNANRFLRGKLKLNLNHPTQPCLIKS